MIKRTLITQFRGIETIQGFWHYSVLLLVGLLLLTGSCKKNDTPATVTDVDGNVYHTVSIGNQVWMAENLKVTHYRNGNSLPNVTDSIQWSNLISGAYCNYTNNENNNSTYGHLYNWYVAVDSRNIAPSGWHIPSDAEWTTLINYLGGNNLAGEKLKEAGTDHWISPNPANNGSGFTALPAGNRTSGNGLFANIGVWGEWWSATEKDSLNAWVRTVANNDFIVYKDPYKKAFGLSVRCVKD